MPSAGAGRRSRSGGNAALKEGYNRLETGLIERACSFLSGEGLPDALPDSGPLTGMTVEHALRLLHLHKNTVFRIGRRPGFAPRQPDIEEVREHIVRKLEVLKRARAHGGTRARDRKEWARRRAKLRSG